MAASRYTLKPDPYSSHSVVLDWLGDGGGRRLLDVGAADGLLARHLTARGWRVTALERDPVAAAAAAAHCEAAVVVDVDREIPALTARFDAVVCADVLEHLADPLRALRGLADTLAPGGHVVISMPNVAHLWMRLSLLAGRWHYADRGILDRTHLRFFTRRTLEALVREAGLAPVRWTATPVPLPQVFPRWAESRALAAAHALGAALSRRAPRLLGYQFIVQAARR
jgi:SAM-dependent methyltransferase